MELDSNPTSLALTFRIILYIAYLSLESFDYRTFRWQGDSPLPNFTRFVTIWLPAVRSRDTTVPSKQFQKGISAPSRHCHFAPATFLLSQHTESDEARVLLVQNCSLCCRGTSGTKRLLTTLLSLQMQHSFFSKAGGADSYQRSLCPLSFKRRTARRSFAKWLIIQ